MSKYISLFTVAIPVNYTSEFREMFEAITYIRIYVCMCVCIHIFTVRIYGQTVVLFARNMAVHILNTKICSVGIKNSTEIFSVITRHI